MYASNGRWLVNFYANQDAGKGFNEIRNICHSLSSHVIFIKMPRDRWNPNWVARRMAGPDQDMYIGLDPSSLTKPCTTSNDDCEGLRRLDGTPYDRRATDLGVETNGMTSVGCFIIKVDSTSNQLYIEGVNDCEVKRSAGCVSQCLVIPRCPVPFELKNGQSHWDTNRHTQGEKSRFVYIT